MTTVMNLSNLEKQIYTCTPEEAVVAAFAQSRKDWNTWEYATRYSWMIERGKECILCGDFSAFRDGRNF